MTRIYKSIRGAEQGSAILMAIMVSVILALLGLAYLAIADQENMISANQRNADQLVYVAETGAKMVKSWFDRPTQGPLGVTANFKFMNVDMRWDPAINAPQGVIYDRSLREVDLDNDPTTGAVAANGTTVPYFRQDAGGVFNAPVTAGGGPGPDPNYLTFWDKPYRGSVASEFRGTENGPDIRIAAGNGNWAWLDVINRDLIGNRGAQQEVGRIQQIDIYAPPIMNINGVNTRYGIATVKVTSTKWRHMDIVGNIPFVNSQSVEVGRQVVKMVLNEVPYPGPSGPFQSCLDFNVNGNVTIHWGEVTSLLGGTFGTGAESSTPPGIPWVNISNQLTGAPLDAWLTSMNDTTGITPSNGPTWFDPWFKFRSGTTITGAPAGVQPYPYGGVPGTSPADIEADNSNLFQASPPICPSFSYNTWKNVALSGGENIHYMVPTGSQDSWREDGIGGTKSLRDWVNGTDGFWFFDTTDQSPPDPNGTNLTQVLNSLSGNWWSGGFIYLNGHWKSTGAGTEDRAVIPPGEPWTDANGDGVKDPGEYVNLKYPCDLGNSDQHYVYLPGDPNAGGDCGGAGVTVNGVSYAQNARDPNGWDSEGIPFEGDVTFQGVIYTEGTFAATGNMFVFGAVVAKGGMKESGGGPTAGTPSVFFDERIVKGGWPPPELALPRTTVTFWETDQ
jgi:hypothetical protein